MGKSRAAAFALGIYVDEGADLQAYDVESSDQDLNEGLQPNGSLFFILHQLITQHILCTGVSFLNYSYWNLSYHRLQIINKV